MTAITSDTTTLTIITSDITLNSIIIILSIMVVLLLVVVMIGSVVFLVTKFSVGKLEETTDGGIEIENNEAYGIVRDGVIEIENNEAYGIVGEGREEPNYEMMVSTESIYEEITI